MILRILKSDGPLTDFSYLIIAVLFWIVSLLQPFSYEFYQSENQGILYAFINKITDGHPLLQVSLSLIFVLLLAVLIQQIKISYALLKVRTKLVSILYIILAGGLVSMHTLHPVYLAALFFVIGIYSLFSVYNNSEPVASIFNAGFFLAIATLFYLNLLIMLPAFLIALSVLRRERKGHEFFVLILGFIVPWLFAFSYALLSNQLNETILVFLDIAITPVNHFKQNYALIAYLGVLTLLTIVGSIKMMQLYDLSKVSIRKYYLIFFIIFLFSLLSYFIPSTSHEMLIITIIPVTFLIANLFNAMESGFWRELLFTLLLGSAIFMQFAHKLLINV